MEIWYRTNLTAHDFIPADYWKSHYEEVKRDLPEAGIYAAKDQKERILGFAGLTGNYIAGLFVKEEWQSHGIGKMVIDRINLRRMKGLSVFISGKALKSWKNREIRTPGNWNTGWCGKRKNR